MCARWGHSVQCAAARPRRLLGREVILATCHDGDGTPANEREHLVAAEADGHGSGSGAGGQGLAKACPYCARRGAQVLLKVPTKSGQVPQRSARSAHGPGSPAGPWLQLQPQLAGSGDSPGGTAQEGLGAAVRSGGATTARCPRRRPPWLVN